MILGLQIAIAFLACLETSKQNCFSRHYHIRSKLVLMLGDNSQAEYQKSWTTFNSLNLELVYLMGRMFATRHSVPLTSLKFSGLKVSLFGPAFLV